MQERPVLQSRSSANSAVTGTSGPLASTPLASTLLASTDDTLDEERREIVASVLGALAGAGANPDEMAACSYLLKHLSQTVRPAGPTAA